MAILIEDGKVKIDQSMMKIRLNPTNATLDEYLRMCSDSQPCKSGDIMIYKVREPNGVSSCLMVYGFEVDKA